jgi:hypothetical protein
MNTLDNLKILSNSSKDKYEWYGKDEYLYMN